MAHDKTASVGGSTPSRANRQPMSADTYHGARASEYEAKRVHRPPWATEQALVGELVRSGPVLDVPIGTGRYLEIYRSKRLSVVGCDVSPDMIAQARRKDAALEVVRGSIFALPFAARQFATAVCTRLLNWLRPEEMARAVAELGRVAQEIILSIRLGVERQWGTYTHAESAFLLAINGLLVDARRVIREEGAQGVYTMFRLRPAVWADAVAQFATSGGAVKLVLLAREWADRYHVAHQDYAACPVRAEYWPRERLAATLAAMTIVEPRLRVTGIPRCEDGPLTLLRFGARYGMIDGRHRANRWAAAEGVYPVLVLECCNS